MIFEAVHLSVWIILSTLHRKYSAQAKSQGFLQVLGYGSQTHRLVWGTEAEQKKSLSFYASTSPAHVPLMENHSDSNPGTGDTLGQGSDGGRGGLTCRHESAKREKVEGLTGHGHASNAAASNL